LFLSVIVSVLKKKLSWNKNHSADMCSFW